MKVLHKLRPVIMALALVLALAGGTISAPVRMPPKDGYPYQEVIATQACEGGYEVNLIGVDDDESKSAHWYRALYAFKIDGPKQNRPFLISQVDEVDKAENPAGRVYVDLDRNEYADSVNDWGSWWAETEAKGIGWCEFAAQVK